MNKVEKRFYLYLLIWMLADMLQAMFTNMHADEAYYALYGQFLDWGYYDHPPMVALLTYLSHWFPGNLSVRMMTVPLHGATVWLVWKTIHDEQATFRDVHEFFIIAFSLFMFVLYGFVTTPDAPLLFFTALFFFLYKKYLEKPSLPLALLLGITMAGMLYSKYMAVLVIAFVLISNFKLLKDWRIWLAGILALALFVPHILWQFHHEFPSLKYHLIVRKDPFSWIYPVEFIPNQLLVYNPVCLGLALWFCWKERKNRDTFVRACVFTCVGFVLFFWVMTANGHAEPHWTIAMSIPMLFLLYGHTREELWHKRIMRYVLPFSVLILVARIGLCTPFVPEFTGFEDRQPKMEAIHEKCGHHPVVFYGSFQNPSLYRYYTGEDASALSSLFNRQTQYDILQLDKEWQGKEVYAVAASKFPHAEQLGDYDLYYAKITHFQGTNRININVENYRQEGDSLVLDVSFRNNYAVPFDFCHPEMPVTIAFAYLHENNYHLEKYKAFDMPIIPANAGIKAQLRFKYFPHQSCVLCLSACGNVSVNSGALSF